MNYRVERDADGNPRRLIWIGPDPGTPNRIPTYDEWRADEMLRRLNKRPIEAVA